MVWFGMAWYGLVEILKLHVGSGWLSIRFGRLYGRVSKSGWWVGQMGRSVRWVGMSGGQVLQVGQESMSRR